MQTVDYTVGVPDVRVVIGTDNLPKPLKPLNPYRGVIR